MYTPQLNDALLKLECEAEVSSLLTNCWGRGGKVDD